MPIQEWIHKYPGVAALPQQEADTPWSVSVEEPDVQQTAATQGYMWTNREQWYEKMCAWAHLMLRQHGPGISLHCFVALDVFPTLCAAATPPGGPGPLELRLSQGWQLTLFGRVTVAPWERCPPGTWMPHWSMHTEQPTMVSVAVGHTRWQHVIHELLGSIDAPLPEYASLCEAVAPALVCPCGGHLLHWR